jgi:2-phosphoglycerate kinase
MALVRRLAAERKSAVIEGVHLLPGFMTEGLSDAAERPLVTEILLTLNDATLHESHLTCRLDGEPARGGNRHLGNFEKIRELQETLKQIASDANISEYDVADPEDLTMQIVNEIVGKARSEAAMAVAS